MATPSIQFPKILSSADVLGIYYKLQTFLYLPASGIIQGMRPVIGYNYGAGERERVSRIFQVALALCACIMMIGTVLCLAFASPLMALFTENVRTVVIGAHALRIICVGFLVSAVSVTASGALEDDYTEKILNQFIQYSGITRSL